VLVPGLRWLGDKRLALRAYGGTSWPGRGEFFTMGGGALFRGFDLAQRQGSTVWVGSAEWRVPLATGLSYDVCDHVLGLRNAYGALFYDVGNTYIRGHAVGPTANAVGLGLRLDMAWFGFVERTTFRIDVARTINSSAPMQIWVGVGVPF
jgi:hemolysin activation/secretion protein